MSLFDGFGNVARGAASASADPDVDDAGPSANERAGLPSRERDYIVAAKDAQGVSFRAFCRCPPELMRLVADVVQAKKYPFRVQGDLIRWCLFVGVKRLAAGAGLPSVLAQMDAINEMCREEQYHLGFAENFREMKRTVDAYLERGAPEKARAFITRIRTIIAAMPNEYWRGEYERDLMGKYAPLMDGAHSRPGARSLFAGTGEGDGDAASSDEKRGTEDEA